MDFQQCANAACKHWNYPGAEYCARCGQLLLPPTGQPSAQVAHCKRCGASVALQGDGYCDTCRARVTGPGQGSLFDGITTTAGGYVGSLGAKRSGYDAADDDDDAGQDDAEDESDDGDYECALFHDQNAEGEHSDDHAAAHATESAVARSGAVYVLDDPSGWRIAGAILVGLLAGPFLSVPLRAGIAWATGPDFDEWGVFFWGNHSFWRFAASIVAAVGASLLASLVARKWGHLIGAACMLPFALVWGIVAYLSWSGQATTLWWQASFIYGESAEAFASKGNLIAATLLALVLVPVGYMAGYATASIRAEVFGRFERRSWSAFGVKWYHYLWAVPIAYPIIAVTAENVVYAIRWFVAGLDAGLDTEYGLGSRTLIPGLFMMAIFATTALLVWGPVRAYRILAGFDEVDGSGRRFLHVVGYALGCPLMAVVLQWVISLLHRGLLWLMN